MITINHLQSTKFVRRENKVRIEVYEVEVVHYNGPEFGPNYHVYSNALHESIWVKTDADDASKAYKDMVKRTGKLLASRKFDNDFDMEETK